MPELNSLYGGAYLAAADLLGKTYSVTIEKVDIATMQGSTGSQTKAVLTLRGIGKGLVLNKVNASMIASSFTWNSDAWIGRVIEIHAEKVAFQGRIVDAIRVRVPPVQPAAVVPVQPVPAAPVQQAATAPLQSVPTAPAQPAAAAPVQPLPAAAPPGPLSPMAALRAMPDDIPY